MASKRPADESGSAGPSAKKAMTRIESMKMGPIYNLEQLDLKVLVFQNKKLAERIEQRKKAENELHKRIEQLENRQRTDDAVLMIVNRYWNQLDEDVRVLLQRLDAETADETETKNESNETTSFLAMLSTWDKQELEETLGQRVEFSKRAIGKLLQAFDRMLQRNEKLHKALENKAEKEKEDLLGQALKSGQDSTVKKEENEDDEKKEEDESGDEKKDEEKDEIQKKLAEVEDVVKSELADLRKENKQMHNLVTQLHQRHHDHTLRISQLQDKVTSTETEIAELKNELDDLQYQFEKADQRCEKLDRLLADAYNTIRTYKETTGAIRVEGVKSIGGTRLDEIFSELEEQRELATNRLTELEKINKDHQEAKKEVEKLKMDLLHLPELVIVETTEYKCLQSKFSVLYNESLTMKTQLEEARNQLQNTKNTHLRHIEQMESDELLCQKKLRSEMIQLEDMLAQVRKEYEMLRIEFEQTLAANEQTGTINREMRNLIQSLQNHNQQLKMESVRYKRRLKEAQADIAKLKAEGAASSTSAPLLASSSSEPKEQKEEAAVATPVETPPKLVEPEVIVVKDRDECDEVEHKEKGRMESDVVRELRAQLKKAQDSQKELKLLLDMYKSAPKEQRDKVMLMAGERKAKQEIEDLKNHIKKMQETERKDRRKLAEDDAIKKIKRMEEIITDLQKHLAAQKQREEALLNDLEVTGQAFEDMQEQNTRLLQQLREKDDANFKLMSERIKSNQIHKLLREEKDILVEQVATLQFQVDAQNLVVRKLEEKERILQSNLSALEKELSLTQQAMDMYKRKAVESSQTAADLKLHLDKYQAQLKEAQVAVADKTGSIEQESYKYKRTQEEIAKLMRKLERSKKIEMAGAADEVLLEEIKEYKEQLTCPSCKVNKKDAVLTKCFHVFCLECLRTRYETRQRKCPKCNAGFGANDFHRLYIG
ncbi:E3 ubiquitin-protein ligase BRE1B-like [Gigantopelta aegis]|uniref:E3 ubiquitin-protein ligase BRE1B-like n=1 Tax=Gigantopelta aegis TaxID=1735272 RepID=UPI001B88E534|nr:E3 ubiquitin-protein ligase BRE1B-like [Gigantopelta aegis]XP_041348775.1 E3 ubiquitin-protein ligase BRE1B-like [Gigantopelta aegis]